MVMSDRFNIDPSLLPPSPIAAFEEFRLHAFGLGLANKRTIIRANNDG